MAIILKCAKGCGENITVPDDAVKEAQSMGRPIEVAHDVCPTDPKAPQRTFKVTVSVFEVVDDEEVLLASVGGKETGGSFTAALPAITKAANAQWEKVAEMSHVIDQGD